MKDNELKGQSIITSSEINEMMKSKEHRQVKVDLEKDLFNLILKYKKEIKDHGVKTKKQVGAIR